MPTGKAAKKARTKGKAATDPADDGATKKTRRLHRGRTVEERKQERRRALLDTALELFGTVGYRATPIERLCRESYVSTGYFYEEFENREDLLIALYDELMGAAIAAGARAERDALTMSDPDERRQHRIATFVHSLVDDRRVARILFLESVGVSPEVEAHRRRAHDAVATYVADYVERRWPNDSPAYARRQTLALAAVGGINEVIVEWVLDENRRPTDQLIDDIVFLVGAMGEGFANAI
jgi:AcrR family transcriptional regulator